MRIEHLSELYVQYLRQNDMLKRELTLLEEWNLHPDKSNRIQMFLVHKRPDFKPNGQYLESEIAVHLHVVNGDGTTTLPSFMKKTYTAPSAYRSTDAGKTYEKVADTIKPVDWKAVGDQVVKETIDRLNSGEPPKKLPPHRLTPIILTQDIPDPDYIAGVSPFKGPIGKIAELREKYKEHE